MKKIFFVSVLALAPVMALAQGTPQTSGVTNLLNSLKSWVDILIPIAVAAAVLFFFWGLARYILAEADESKIAGRHMMLWGVIALFVIVSIWGLVAFLGNLFGINTNQGTPPVLPSVPDVTG
jgi:hypothetical protein